MNTVKDQSKRSTFSLSSIPVIGFIYSLVKTIIIKIAKDQTKRSTFFFALIPIALGFVYFLANANTVDWGEDIEQSRVYIDMSVVFLFVTFFSLLPAFIYATFDEVERKNTKRQAIKELESHNIKDKPTLARVQRHFDTAYRAQAYRIPVFLVTFSIAVGWNLVVFSEGASLMKTIMGSDVGVSNLFNKLGESHIIVFGFLGAYSYSILVLFHRYITKDMRSSLFTHITIRIWLVMIISIVLASIWKTTESEATRQWLVATAFIVGFFPNVGITLIKEVAVSGKDLPNNITKTVKKAFKSNRISVEESDTSKNIPLNKIQGLNMWNQSRLAEEDIDNVQNLASSDIMYLICNTRFGLMRILNWVDQAILLFHIGKENQGRFNNAFIRKASEFWQNYKLERKEPYNDERKPFKNCGLGCVPPAPIGLVKSLGYNSILEDKERKKIVGVLEKNDNLDEESRKYLISDLKSEESPDERVRNLLISVDSDLNFRRLWDIRKHVDGEHNKPPSDTGSQ